MKYPHFVHTRVSTLHTKAPSGRKKDGRPEGRPPKDRAVVDESEPDGELHTADKLILGIGLAVQRQSPATGSLVAERQRTGDEG